MNNMDYKKYYNLERYLFDEVGPKFRNGGGLSTEDFFCIVIWKANRSKTNWSTKIGEKLNL